MKKLNYINIILLSLAISVTFSCTDDFEELNKNDNAVTGDRIDVDLLFTRATVYGALRYTEFQRAQHLYTNQYIQYYATSVDYFQTDRYITRNDWLTAYWTEAYVDYGMQTQQVINLTEEDETLSNKTNIARIWKAFLVHRITDLWGDVPYFEAWTGNTTPEYTPQEEIYLDMLNELKEAESLLDPSKDSFDGADLIYGGDVNLWAKFANSLRLRLAMRLSEVAPAVAEEHVSEILAEGNIIASNSESAIMPYGRDFGNFDESVQPMSLIRSFNEYRASNTLVDYLKENNDPRLELFIAPAENTGEYTGLQNGLNPSEINVLNVDDFSRESLIVSSPSAPSVLLSYSEVQFLQAEAALRGWTSGNTQEFYEEGITSSINFWISVYEDLQTRLPQSDVENLPEIDITNAEIEAFLAGAGVSYNPNFALEQIITQKWLSYINQGFEPYAEYRRTGYPVLNEIPNTDGLSETGGTEVPVRLRYPAEEQALNNTNYEEAISRQGPDLPTTHIWWDAD
ncbi:SusD/RagB family nutrient-binding outer membrane lipoprotein [Mangrovivirga cuniculi]|uniref:SusD/RagB family nutrient-binding outer membrane lipoprotein n=1 Tax=Mangrovivirga cuniculi TaxID=2715131 RepID=A0A4D7K1E5_9BACT|nr:SusD/RagB family nutrient-binding outer membrane lipoprotein [Mangrovivirga cuniculi]QCK16755.1 hypothetical protein DCC35_19465 [Mangrovivirga cuniculi]